jgi:AraC family transcriptional regulator of arabinose operon
MRPCLVDRPKGTGDYLFMLFHSPVQVRVGRKDREWPPSSFMIWTPQDGHFYGNASVAWNHSWFHCAGRDIAPILKASRLPVGKPFPLTDPSLMERYLLETVAELKGWRKPDETVLRNLFENLARTLARNLFDQTERLAPTRLFELKGYLEEHFTEGLGLPHLARRAGWSIPHLCTEFKRFFGISIIQYIQQLRMNQAAYLLRDHNWTISEIAAALGYADLYTFSKMFKRNLGMSPRRFRQMNTR